MKASDNRGPLVFAAILGAAGLLAGYVTPSPMGDLLRFVLIAVAFVLVVVSLVSRRRAGGR